MAEEIINRVANSKLKVIDLEDFYPIGERIIFDIQPWLYEGLVLREKEFRAFVEAHQWERYSNTFVALHCSADAIIPDWAFMLVASRLQPFTHLTVIGHLWDLELIAYTQIIDRLDVSDYKNAPVIIKGCSEKPVPNNALVLLTQKLQPIAKSIMYGEACSSVPIFKRKA